MIRPSSHRSRSVKRKRVVSKFRATATRVGSREKKMEETGLKWPTSPRGSTITSTLTMVTRGKLRGSRRNRSTSFHLDFSETFHWSNIGYESALIYTRWKRPLDARNKSSHVLRVFDSA